MNVLFLTGDFPSPCSPASGLFNQYLARAMAREHDVRVVCPVSWISASRAWTRRRPFKSKSHIRSADETVVHPLYFYPPKVLHQCYDTFLWWSVRRAVRRVLDNFRPDVVLAYWAHPDGAVAVRIARELGVPSGVIIGGSDVLLITRDPARRRKVVEVLQSVDAVFTVSQHLKQATIDLGIPADKIHVWHQGVDEHFTPGERGAARRRLGLPVDEKAIVWVGHMVPVKGLEILLKACTIMRQSNLEFHLYLVGHGPLRKRLEAYVAANGLANVVHFAGAQLHDVLPDWYRAADLTVLPSRSEGLPNVLRESMACGTPFVATRVGGIPEIATDHPEWLVNPGDAARLAEALTRMLSKPSPLSSTYHSVTWRESASALLDIFQPVAAPSDIQEAVEIA